MAASAHAPVLVIGRQGQVASALQRLAPALLPQRPLVMAGRPELELAAPEFAEQQPAHGQPRRAGSGRRPGRAELVCRAPTHGGGAGGGQGGRHPGQQQLPS